MMRIGVVSDTHGHIENLKEALKALLEMKIEVFCHLGDDYDDMRDVNVPSEIQVIQVPGVFSEYYKDPNIPNRLIMQWEGKSFLLTHTRTSHKNDLKEDPDPEELLEKGKVDAVLYGHTHIPAIIMEGKSFLFNPGHLKDEDKKGFPPTFGLISVEKDHITAQIFELKTQKILYQAKLIFIA